MNWNKRFFHGTFYMHNIRKCVAILKTFHELFKFYNTLFITEKEKRKIKHFKNPIWKISPLGQCHAQCLV